MHIVIGGEDEVAYRLAEELMEDHEVVLITPDDARRPVSVTLDVATVRGLTTTSSVLRKARTEKADVFIACSPDDEQNLVACVAARRLGALKTICFLFKRDIRTNAGDDIALAELMGIDQVVRPALQLAEEIVTIARAPGALDVEAFEGGRVRLLRHQIEKDAPITGGPLKEVGVPDGVVLVMGRRGEEMFIPTGDTQFQAGDKVTAMGNRRGTNRLLQRLVRSADHGRDDRSATVIGGGTVGLAVAKGLSRGGWSIKLIEPDLARCEAIAPLVDGLVLHGDGSDLNLLEQEQVGECSVLVAVTNSDEKNLLVSLLAKQLGVPRILTRAVLSSNERLFERVGIDVVLSSQGAAIESMVRSLVPRKRELLAELEHGDAEVLELTLPKGLRPIALRNLHLPIFAIVGAIRRGSKVIIPRGNDELRPGDHVLVFCTRADEERTRELFLEALCKDDKK
jgi:trk/ktr system potassium uptake protein